MQTHFHVGRVPVTISIAKGDDQARELEELRTALLFYAMNLPVEGARARYVLRRWAGAAR